MTIRGLHWSAAPIQQYCTNIIVPEATLQTLHRGSGDRSSMAAFWAEREERLHRIWSALIRQSPDWISDLLHQGDMLGGGEIIARFDSRQWDEVETRVGMMGVSVLPSASGGISLPCHLRQPRYVGVPTSPGRQSAEVLINDCRR